jgi:hypothetical protein
MPFPLRQRLVDIALAGVVSLVICHGSAWGIDYGTPVPDGLHTSVGLVTVDLGGNQTTIGTGTLVAERIVLTAAHVIQDAPTPGHISFHTGTGGKGDFMAQAILYRTHPGYYNMRSEFVVTDDERNFLDADLISCGASDVAILLLDRPAPKGTEFYSLLTTELQPADKATAIGYGLDERKRSGTPRKMQGTLEYFQQYEGASLFRTPPGAKQRTDHGDSGGPLLVESGGRIQIAAITHGFYTSLKIDEVSPDEYGIYVSMPQQHDWIEYEIERLTKYRAPGGNLYFLARSNRQTPFMAITARQLFSLAKADTPPDRLLTRIFSRGLNEPIPEAVAAGWQKRYSLSPGTLVPVKLATP